MVVMRHALRTTALAVAVVVAFTACGGDDTGDAAGGEAESASTTVDETTSTTLSPEDEVLADYTAAEAAVKAAYDPADPDHPDLLAYYAGAMLERHQTTLSEYQAEGLSDVLVSKESTPEVVSVTDTTALIENCMTEVLQVTNSTTREPQAEPRTYTALVEFDLEHIDDTWKIVDARTIEETC
jgi:hypothetical protein